jgi:hypothetical protein
VWVFEDFQKSSSEPMPLSEKKLCSVGPKWVYILTAETQNVNSRL